MMISREIMQPWIDADCCFFCERKDTCSRVCNFYTTAKRYNQLGESLLYAVCTRPSECDICPFKESRSPAKEDCDPDARS